MNSPLTIEIIIITIVSFEEMIGKAICQYYAENEKDLAFMSKNL